MAAYLWTVFAARAYGKFDAVCHYLSADQASAHCERLTDALLNYKKAKGSKYRKADEESRRRWKKELINLDCNFKEETTSYQVRSRRVYLHLDEYLEVNGL